MNLALRLRYNMPVRVPGRALMLFSTIDPSGIVRRAINAPSGASPPSPASSTVEGGSGGDELRRLVPGDNSIKDVFREVFFMSAPSCRSPEDDDVLQRGSGGANACLIFKRL
jgi:hypothetical protein